MLFSLFWGTLSTVVSLAFQKRGVRDRVSSLVLPENGRVKAANNTEQKKGVFGKIMVEREPCPKIEVFDVSPLAVAEKTINSS